MSCGGSNGIGRVSCCDCCLDDITFAHSPSFHSYYSSCSTTTDSPATCASDMLCVLLQSPRSGVSRGLRHRCGYVDGADRSRYNMECRGRCIDGSRGMHLRRHAFVSPIAIILPTVVATIVVLLFFLVVIRGEVVSGAGGGHGSARLHVFVTTQPTVHRTTRTRRVDRVLEVKARLAAPLRATAMHCRRAAVLAGGRNVGPFVRGGCHGRWLDTEPHVAVVLVLLQAT